MGGGGELGLLFCQVPANASLRAILQVDVTPSCLQEQPPPSTVEDSACHSELYGVSGVLTWCIRGIARLETTT
jgi:hypothetical protein